MTAVFSTDVNRMTFAEFLAWKPEDKRYELHQGVPFEMQPVGRHEEICGFLSMQISIEVNRLKLPCFLPGQALIKAPEAETGYTPDVMVVRKEALQSEPLWRKSSTICQGSSILLVVEVVSTNWRKDYGYKLTDYEELGISEYWIVDYLALAGRRYLGDLKVPTISVYQLVDNEYQLEFFRGSDLIRSAVFPELTLTADQIFQAEF